MGSCSSNGQVRSGTIELSKADEPGYIPTDFGELKWLNYKSGIRPILEDKKGNIWFGDRDTGAWKFDGKTMENLQFKMD